MTLSRPMALVGLLLLAGCQGPSVKLSTPEPIVIDINMRVDIHERGGGAAAQASPGPASPEGTAAAEARRRARMGDIQTFKNSRLVGENHLGLLVVLNRPEGSYGKYVATTVAEENADRLVLMRQLANERGTTLEDLQLQQGELWRNRSFSGEWIEVLQDNNVWRWAQKR